MAEVVSDGGLFLFVNAARGLEPARAACALEAHAGRSAARRGAVERCRRQRGESPWGHQDMAEVVSDGGLFLFVVDKGEYPFRPKGVLHEEGKLLVPHRNKRFPPAVYLVFCGTMSTYLHD